ncbi:MAG: hypothetical protein ACYSSN_10910 [Planctomycetota bacterium]
MTVAIEDILQVLGSKKLENTLAHLASEQIQNRYCVNGTVEEYIIPDELLEDFLSSLDFFRFEQRPERWARLKRHYGPVVINHLLAIEREITCNRGFLDRYDHSTLRKLIFEDPVWSRIRGEARAVLDKIGFDLVAWEQKYA